jgi:hypothetical protein
MVGASGTVAAGTKLFDGTDATPVPSPFVALTLQV